MKISAQEAVRNPKPPQRSPCSATGAAAAAIPRLCASLADRAGGGARPAAPPQPTYHPPASPDPRKTSVEAGARSRRRQAAQVQKTVQSLPMARSNAEPSRQPSTLWWGLGFGRHAPRSTPECSHHHQVPAGCCCPHPSNYPSKNIRLASLLCSTNTQCVVVKAQVC